MRKILNILLVFACVLTCVTVMSSCTLFASCVSHTDMDSNGKCDACGEDYTCPGHKDANADSMCDFCLAEFSCSEHYDSDADLKCDVCGVAYVCPGHTDTDANAACDICRAPYTCPGHCDINVDGVCDECRMAFVCPGHKDADGNSRCDVCKAYWTCPGHKDSNGDLKCDFCKAEFECVGHIDEGIDGRCDLCDALYTCPGHEDANNDNKCDVCKAYYKPPVDFRSEFVAAVKATKPNVLVINITTTEVGKFTLNSAYTVTYGQDGSFVISGTVESLNPSLSGDLIISTPINITCDAQGNYSDGGEFAGSNPAAQGISIDFMKLKNYSTPSSTILNATVAKADTASVFGVAYSNDVTLVVNKSESAITSVSVSYANVVISCEYK